MSNSLLLYNTDLQDSTLAGIFNEAGYLFSRLTMLSLWDLPTSHISVIGLVRSSPV